MVTCGAILSYSCTLMSTCFLQRRFDRSGCFSLFESQNFDRTDLAFKFHVDDASSADILWSKVLWLFNRKHGST